MNLLLRKIEIFILLISDLIQTRLLYHICRKEKKIVLVLSTMYFSKDIDQSTGSARKPEII